MEVETVTGAGNRGIYLDVEGPCGVAGVPGPGDGGARSSATTNKSCSRPGPPNAICKAPGWTHICSHGTENLTWNEPSAAVITSRVRIGDFSGEAELPEEPDSSVAPSSYSVGSAAYRERRTVRFTRAEDQKGCKRASRFACHRWRSDEPAPKPRGVAEEGGDDLELREYPGPELEYVDEAEEAEGGRELCESEE